MDWEKLHNFAFSMISNETNSMIPIIRNYFAEQPVLQAYLFGSCARGEETNDSDVDILVKYDYSKGVTLFTICKMMLALQKLINRPVDLVEESGLKAFAAPSADNDKILIYERAN